jgi:hypothetical protein
MQGVKFYSIYLTEKSPVGRENLIWREKGQNWMFMDSIGFYWRFIWIYRGLDCKENWVLSQFRL